MIVLVFIFVCLAGGIHIKLNDKMYYLEIWWFTTPNKKDKYEQIKDLIITKENDDDKV